MLLPTASNLLNRAFSFSFSFSSPPLLLSPCFYYTRRIQTLKSTPPKALTAPATTTTTTTTNDAAAAPIMAKGGGGADHGEGDRYRDPSANPKVARLRELVSAGDATADGWEKCWDKGLTPWDLGRPTPVVPQLVQSGTLPKGRVLVPGCGLGYDVVAFASPGRFVVGLDISDTAIRKAKEWSSSLPNANFFTFMAEDFFIWQPTELFDLIFDYTFFCAIDPSMRSAWARKIRDILKPDGELITLIYVITDQQEGPPYNTTVADYEEVLSPVGFKALFIEDNEFAVGPRKGREKVGRWKRYKKLSSL
ncbi:thiocyanate methyltransferase 1-like isoform X1 [Ananas comosus]|uniref:Thiocyanate methyltransferase 1-like isoform X1 n=1 Tax=Ananas comosus TaxID=4615 RepID=A0A6P5F8R1_ANACO|nr:thiocyanate methyltransferase 1-like isoform X1 [Ananas comosus]